MDYSWIQISDLHLFDNTETKIIKSSFRKIAQNHLIKFIVVTGDLHQYGESYEKTKGFLEAVRTSFSLRKKDVFIVPGNHDCGDCNNKKQLTYYIEDQIENDPDCYAESFVPGKIIDCFNEYDTFIHDYYDDGSPYVNPEQICVRTWNNQLNIIHLNTAINCNGDNLLGCIVDIKKLGDLKIRENIPSIVIAHHPFSAIHESHQNYLKRYFTDWNVSAYLCGDVHKEFLDKIETHSYTMSAIPCFVCGKTAPQTHDKYSDIGCIVYDKIDYNVYVTPFVWNLKLKRFDESSVMSSDQGKPVFQLFNEHIKEAEHIRAIDAINSEHLPIWLPDAEFADGSQARFENYTQTNRVNSFLKDDSYVWGLSAVRGVGKTFILQIMRSKLGSDKLKLPIGIEPDKFNNWGTEKIDIRKSSEFRGMKEFENVVSLWEYSFVVYSVNQLINLQNDLSDEALEYIKQIRNATESYYKNGEIDTITIRLCNSDEVDSLNYIITEILNYTTWPNFVDRDYSILLRLKKRIQALLKCMNKSGVLILVDKLDQAVPQTNTEIPNCDNCEKKNYVNSCNNEKKGEDFCLTANCQNRCCFGCEIYQSVYSSHGLRIYGEGNKRLWHINVWQYIQQGLVKAVYNISLQYNGLIRVYYTIRQEAFAREDNLLGDQGRKMRNTVVELWYSKEEQQKIFNACIRDENPEFLYDKSILAVNENEYEKAFVGTDRLCHPFVQNLNESVFNSIYRHSFDRARDIQEYGKYLSTRISDLRDCKNEAERGEKVKKYIEDHAAKLAFFIEQGGTLSDFCYYSEKKILLPNFWANTDNFQALLECFEKNLLFPNEAKKLCKSFNNKMFNNNKRSCSSNNCSKCSVHPFSMLYKLGMLGRIRITRNNDDDVEQDFIHSKLVTYITGNDIDLIQDNTIYVLHPALTKSIDHGIHQIKHFTGFIIGKGLKVKKSLLLELQQEYKKNMKEFNKKYFY